MHKYTNILLSAAFLLSGCISVNQISLDQLEPAEICFPEQIRNVAVISKVPANKEDVGYVNSNTLFTVDLNDARNILSNRVADAKYFDKVIVCDSAINNSSDIINPEYLSQDAVLSLLDEFDSDMLISIDKLNVSFQKLRSESMGVPFDVVSCIATPQIKFYISKRKAPMYIVQKSDTTYYNILDLVDQKQIIKEASEEAIAKSVNMVLPYWNNIVRYYYTGGYFEMRDAEVALKENDWDGAFNLWKHVYDNKKGKLKEAAAFNVAIYYEFKDNIPEAIKWLDLSVSGTKQDSNFKSIAQAYKNILLKREKDLAKLKIQMDRFTTK